jgi:hypothetical protein
MELILSFLRICGSGISGDARVPSRQVQVRPRGALRGIKFSKSQLHTGFTFSQYIRAMTY